MKTLITKTLLTLLLFAAMEIANAQTTRYVKPVGSGIGNGSSWANASGNLQAMINTSGTGDQIWVANGTYKPTADLNGDPNPADARSKVFMMKNGVAIYGGFAGTETQLSARNWKINVTTLSGDYNGNDIISGSGSNLSITNNSENAYRIVYNNDNGLNSSAVLDGFTIKGGNALDYGGGMYNYNSSPAITNCIFSGNAAGFEGAGIYNFLASPNITNCSFSGNKASSSGGGGIYNYNSSYPIITNCCFSGNYALSGGGIYNHASSPIITNCIIWNNTTGITGPAAVTYSIIQDGYTGTGNLDADPLFVDAANGNLHLQVCSPAINTGTNSVNSTTIDLDGNPRKVGIIDMGAYEFQGTNSVNWVLDADKDGYYTGSIVSQCASPGTGYVIKTTEQAGDCDDNNPNGHVTQTWYLDADNDGHYVSSQSSCGSPGAGYTTSATGIGDCNDNDNTKWNGGGLYVDADGDGYTVGFTTAVCYGATIPAGYAATSLGNDCDDNDNTKWKSAFLYVDADGDGYSVGTLTAVCYGATIPAGYVAAFLGNDCDDNNAAATIVRNWYLDADNDGHYLSFRQSCGSPGLGYNTTATLSGDCDDNDATKWRSITVFVDADGDGYVVAGSQTSICYGATIPAGYAATPLGADCNDNDAAKWQSANLYVDADGDGYSVGSLTAVCYGATIPTGYVAKFLGNDCNDNDNTKWRTAQLFVDADGDGYTVGAATAVCYGATIPAGYRLNSLGSDCNDSDPNIHGALTWYLDADNDGHYVSSQSSCTSPGIEYNTTATQRGDCNDNDASIWQNGQLAMDADGDGYTAGPLAAVCYGATIPIGYVATTLGIDCDDNDASKWRSAFVYLDNDGDGYDDGLMTVCYGTAIPPQYKTGTAGPDCDDTDATKWRSSLFYVDADGDGYTLGSGIMICYGTSIPAGYITISHGTDCNDADATINPTTKWYRDNDGDGYGTGVFLAECTRPTSDFYLASELTAISGDCNDANAALNPATQWYLDADNDGYYTGAGVTACTSPGAGYKYTGVQPGDCNDSNPLVNPGVTEICGNGIDDNCDGVIDEDCPTYTYFVDADGDGYGATESITTTLSTPPYSYTAISGDCNDNNPFVNPGVIEVCGNGIDDNCNGVIDECTTYWRDADGDGYGKSTSPITIVNSSAPPSGYAPLNGDCDDGNPSVHPGATEICGNGIDDNCNGEIDECITYWLDDDGDGYGRSNSPITILNSSAPPSGYILLNGDCDDGNTSVHPGATEICGNGIDDNCNGVIDEGCITYYFDGDGDGYGKDDATISSLETTPPLNYVAIAGDCNDDDPSVYPGAQEICGNGVDDNCNGDIDEDCPVYTYYLDADGDGYGGDYWQTSIDPTPPPGYVTIGGDCVDYNNSIHPGATEICNRIDDNCDGVIDEGCLKEQLPDFTKTDINGISHHFYGDLAEGKAVVIEFSTGWCPFSHIAEPQISNVYDDICQGQGNIKLYDIIFENETQGHASDDAYGIVYANHHNATYPVIANSQDVYSDFAYEYSLGSVPSFLVVIPDASDPAKSIVYIIVGAIDNLTDSIENILTSHGYSITPPPSLNITVTGNVCDLPSPVTLTSNQPSGNVWSTGETTKSITITAPGVYSLSYVAGCGTITKKVYIAERVTTTALLSSAATVCADKGIFNLTYSGEHPASVLEYSVNGANWNTYLEGFGGEATFFNQWSAGTTVYFRVKEMVPNSVGLPDCEGYSNIVQIVSQPLTGPAFEIAASSTCSFPITLTSPYPDNFWSTEETTQSITVNSPGFYYVVSTAACGYVYDDITVGGPTWYRDADGDGYGDGAITTAACDQPDGYVSDGTDCNDNDASIHPGATEICDGLDNNCDGLVDEGFAKTTYYQDADADGFGDPFISINACSKPAGYVINKRDCNDADASVHPGAPEICDGIDNNCNGQVDEGFTKVTYYLDVDGDGYGNPVEFIRSCYVPEGYVTNKKDCNDGNAAIYPGAPEICDGLDNNCNGQVDEGFTKVTYYRDADGDGYGDPVMLIRSCSVPVGYVTNKRDCNDANAAIHPGALEIFDSIDNNCNGFIDENCAALTISDLSVIEGNKNQKTVNFAVKLSKKSTQTITVDYATQDSIAMAGSDYIVKSGTLTFLPGTVKQNIAILIIGDRSVEPNEIFNVVLSNGVNAPINKTTGTGTIVNDDGNVSSALAVAIPGEKHSLALTPNPAGNTAKINLQGYTGNITIQLRNMEGKLLKEEKTVGVQAKFIQLQMGVSNYTNGAYLITVFDEKGNRQTAKLIIQH